MTHKVALAYIHPGNYRAEFADSLILTLMDERFKVTPLRKKSGTNVQIARNEIARFFTDQTDCDYFLSVDTDIEFTPDDIEALIEKDVPIVSGLYLGIQETRGGLAFPVGHAWATPYKMGGAGPDGNAVRPLKQDDIVDDELLEVAGVGMGFCLIKREVFEALFGVTYHQHPSQYPFAVGQLRMESGGFLFAGEDITFCIRAEALGFPSYLAPDVKVGHAKSFMVYPNGAGPATMEVAETKEIALV